MIESTRKDMATLMNAVECSEKRRATIMELMLYSTGRKLATDFINDLDLALVPIFAKLVGSDANSAQTQIVLRRATFGDAGAKILAPMLATTSTLEQLTINDSTIGQNGLGALAISMASTDSRRRTRVIVAGAEELLVGYHTGRRLLKPARIDSDGSASGSQSTTSAMHSLSRLSGPSSSHTDLLAAMSAEKVGATNARLGVLPNGMQLGFQRQFANGDCLVLPCREAFDHARLKPTGRLLLRGTLIMDAQRQGSDWRSRMVVVLKAVAAVVSYALQLSIAALLLLDGDLLLSLAAWCFILVGTVAGMALLLAAGRSAVAAMLQLCSLTILLDSLTALRQHIARVVVEVDIANKDSLHAVFAGGEAVHRLFSVHGILQAAPLSCVSLVAMYRRLMDGDGDPVLCGASSSCSATPELLGGAAVFFMALAVAVLVFSDRRAISASGRSKLSPPRIVTVPWTFRPSWSPCRLPGDGFALLLYRLCEIPSRVLVATSLAVVVGSSALGVLMLSNLALTAILVDGCRCRPTAESAMTTTVGVVAFPGAAEIAPGFVHHGRHSPGCSWPRPLMMTVVAPLFLLIMLCTGCNETWEQEHWDGPDNSSFRSHLPDRFYFLGNLVMDIIVLQVVGSALPAEALQAVRVLLYLALSVSILKHVFVVPFMYVVNHIGRRSYYCNAPRLLQHTHQVASVALYMGKMRQRLHRLRARQGAGETVAAHAQRARGASKGTVSPEASDGPVKVTAGRKHGSKDAIVKKAGLAFLETTTESFVATGAPASPTLR